MVIIGVIAVLHALSLERRLDSLPHTIEQAEAAAEAGHISDAQADLQKAQQLLTSTNSTLYNSPDFSLISFLPVAKQNIDAIRGVTSLALQMVGGGEQVLNAAKPLVNSAGQLEVPLSHGLLPLDDVENVQSALASLVTQLPLGPPPSNSFVLGRVRNIENKIYNEAAKKRTEFQNVASSLKLVQDIAGADGAQRYLIAVSNSAEMRGSGGMILSYGILTSHEGQLKLGKFGPISDLQLNSPETKVSFPADFTKSYGYLNPTQDWNNVNVMSDFTVDAPVMEAMFTKATGLPVNGVIQVDSEGLAALLTGVGPVQTTDLGRVTASNVVPVTLSDSYAEYPNRTQRQDYTGEVAQAAFSQLVSGSLTGLKTLGTALVSAAQQHHVLIYENDPTDETAIQSLGFSGALPPPNDAFVQLTVQNFSGNKLDYYVKSSLALSGNPPSEVGSHMIATVTINNTAPAGQTSPLEVFGPYNANFTAGEYQGLVTLYLPANTYLQSSHQTSTVIGGLSSGTQNGVRTVSFTVQLPAGSNSEVTMELDVPPSDSPSAMFEYVPSPRVIPTVFSQKFS